MAGAIEDQHLKILLKEALVEILEERRDLVRDVLEEALEDIAFVHAIREGMDGDSIDRSQIFGILSVN